VTRRTMAQVTIWLASMAVIAVVSLAEALVQSWWVVAVCAAAAAGAYGLGRRHGRRSDGRREVIAARLAGIGRDDWQPERGSWQPEEDPREARTRLLDDPRSGARPLGGRQWPR
jgi:hypothetical protein